MHSYLAIPIAIVIAGVLISASLFVAFGGAKTTTTTAVSVTTTTMTQSCSAASNLSPSLHFAFDVTVNYSGPWNATLTAYSAPFGSTSAIFTQCYIGSGAGYVVLNDWSPNGTTLLEVSAHKMDGDSGNLTLSVNAASNYTAAPFGSVSASITLSPISTLDQSRLGPISSFPDTWVNACNQTVTGNTTTNVDLDLNISSALDHINLDQVYAQVISSPSFVQQSGENGWVVAEWTAGEASGTGISGELDQVMGLFVLTNDGAPDGYIWVYYDLDNGTVTTAFASALTGSCPTTGFPLISDPGDLSLQLSIGAPVGQSNTVQLNISEYNDALSYNNVSASSGWPVSGLSLGPCGTFEFPFGVVLYLGYYTDQNVSSGTPLTIYTPNANMTSAPRPDCPAKPDVFSYDFAPQSDYAVVNLNWADGNTSSTYSLSDSVSIIGYWSESAGTEAFHPLDPGIYTVLAGDEWGNTVLQYITVK